MVCPALLVNFPRKGFQQPLKLSSRPGKIPYLTSYLSTSRDTISLRFLSGFPYSICLARAVMASTACSSGTLTYFFQLRASVARHRSQAMRSLGQVVSVAVILPTTGPGRWRSAYRELRHFWLTFLIKFPAYIWLLGRYGEL